MLEKLNQTCYCVNLQDNVATALDDLQPGTVQITGAVALASVQALQEIPFGHKIALKNLACGAPVYKFGAQIATTTKEITAGEHVHLHNIKSDFDEKAATYNIHTAHADGVEYNVY